MTRSANVENAITLSAQLESLLRILSMAADGEQICGTSFADNGGGTVIDMAVELAGRINETLEARPPSHV